MNILSFIDNSDLDAVNDIVSFQYINLHTRNGEKAISQCKAFFNNYETIGNNLYFYTASSDYQWHGGYRYSLDKDKDGVWWLVRKNEYIEI